MLWHKKVLNINSNSKAWIIAVQSLIQIRCTISRKRRLIGWNYSQFVDPQPCASKPIEDNSPTNICRKKDFYFFSISQKKISYNLELGEMHKPYTTQSPVILLVYFYSNRDEGVESNMDILRIKSSELFKH